jgi:hypothetical protein
MFSNEFAWGFPPAPVFLDAHRALLAEVAPGAPWMVAGGEPASAADVRAALAALPLPQRRK